jgi:Ala-tRNA(Pro) deacylase
MYMSPTLEECLRRIGSRYEIVHHPHSECSMDTAQAAHVPGDRLAKTVILQDDEGFAAAVLPSTYHLQLYKLWEETGRKLVLATEDEVRELFKDCEVGAVPPVAMAYGMPTFIDESLMRQPDVYFEAGDHEDLVHMQMDDFMRLMSDAERVRCSHRMH